MKCVKRTDVIRRHGPLGGSFTKTLTVVLLALVLSISIAVHAQDRATDTVRNFIYMIGDGMSFEQLEAARIVKGGPLVMDRFPIQHQAVNASLDNAVTDSAAAGTALATGYRTNNGMVAMLPDGQRVTSVLRSAQQNGRATGVVVTDVLYGATPGAFIANVPRRQDQADILEQAIFVTQPRLMLGGGMAVFHQIGAADRLDTTSYKVVTTRDELLDWDIASEANLLGLFASGTMTYEVDRKESEPHIREMVETALGILSQDENGFFLMVEGARIDHAGHANDLPRMVHEVLAFDEAIAAALAFAASRDDTVVLVTADHETGGLTPGSHTPSPKVIQDGVAAVRTKIGDALQKDPQADIDALFREYAGISDLGAYTAQGNLAALLEHILNERSFYYTTTGHSAAPVPVIAFGPGAERFLEANHIKDVGRITFELLELTTGGDPS